MITEILYLDACLPGYFQGYGGVVLAVPCHAGMTWNGLRQGIEDDSNASDYGVDDWSGFEAALDSAFDTIGDMGSRVDFLDHDQMESDELEAEESELDMGESVYAYFGLVADCAVCHGKQWDIFSRSADNRLAVERCDACSPDTFSDADAAKLASAAGVDCGSSYPCYLLTGPFCPIPREDGADGPVVILPGSA